jgi:hypothetical protein
MFDGVGVVSGQLAVLGGDLTPAQFLEAPGPTRAAVSFLLTVLAGGWVVYVYGDRLRTTARGSLSRPLSSVLYGFVAAFVVGFVVTYGSTVLSAAGVAPSVVAVLGAVAVVGVLLVLGGLGFAVVGVWIAWTLGLRDPLLGVVVVGIVSAAAWAVPWVAVGAVVWAAIAVVGVGGPTRAWVHRDTLAVDRR